MSGMAQELTPPAVVTAVMVDSINPCAFAVLLTFIAATLVLAERADRARPARPLVPAAGWAWCTSWACS
jgi:hypothetical protein